jgi:hypothetical protein
MLEDSELAIVVASGNGVGRVASNPLSSQPEPFHRHRGSTDIITVSTEDRIDLDCPQRISHLMVEKTSVRKSR